MELRRSVGSTKLASHRATSVWDLYHMALCSVVALHRERRFIIYLNQRLAGNGFN